MRRFLRIAVAVGIVAATQVPLTAGAAPPTRFPTIAITGTIPAGFLCAFDVDTGPVGTKTQTETDFYDGNHNLIRQTFTGPLFIFLINDSTGKRIVENASGPGTTYPHSDGSSFNVGRGQGLIGLFPTDEGGPALFAVDGHDTFTRAPDGSIHNLVITGTVTDLCAVLAG
ncbi:MAG TPA: hypothetical protein VGX22_13050 [Candidatus Dormibacteraeota bacterium]|nr:hypothetical protein [Candidatus Dormibacteraeota bacterium]